MAIQEPVRVAKAAPLDFEALVRAHHRRLLAYALALTRRNDAAEDLVQDALLIAHRDLAKFDASRDFGPWIRGIVRMKYLEWVRAHRMERLDGALLDSLEERHQEWDRAALEGRADLVATVRACLQLLAGHIGDTVEMFYTKQQACAAIAARLGTSETVVRKRLQRARESLADCVRRKMGSTGV